MEALKKNGDKKKRKKARPGPGPDGTLGTIVKLNT